MSRFKTLASFFFLFSNGELGHGLFCVEQHYLEFLSSVLRKPLIAELKPLKMAVRCI